MSSFKQQSIFTDLILRLDNINIELYQYLSDIDFMLTKNQFSQMEVLYRRYNAHNRFMKSMMKKVKILP